MRQILCAVILVCAVATLAAGQTVAKKSAPVAKPAATADAQQILKDRFREYTEALTKRDVAAPLAGRSGPRGGSTTIERVTGRRFGYRVISTLLPNTSRTAGGLPGRRTPVHQV